MPEIVPAVGLTARGVADVLAVAGRAPSVYNTQPWSFRTTSTSIELYADRSRALPVADPDGYELELSCGAALLNLQLSLIDRGVRPLVSYVPDPDRADRLAVVRHGGTATPTRAQRALIDAVPRRITNRRPFAERPVPNADVAAMRRAAQEESGWLRVVESSEEIVGLERLAEAAHRRQISDHYFRAEQARWIATAASRNDGVPAATGGPLPEGQDHWVKRDFTAGTGRARVFGKDFEERPLLLVLGTLHPGPRPAVRSGQALQRVLLTATSRGLNASFLSHVVEVEQTREGLRHLLHSTRRPDAVVRIGYGSPVPGSPRRPPAETVAPRPEGGAAP